MYRGNNKVAMASQQRIRKALLALLEREDFDSISTSALCREAAVSRQTFYNLYSSKEDVVVDLLGYYRYDPSVCEKYGKNVNQLIPHEENGPLGFGTHYKSMPCKVHRAE